MRFFLPLLFLAACTSTQKDSDSSPSTDDSTGGGGTDCAEGGSLYLVAEDGSETDLSAEVLAGTAAAPAAITLSSPGTVHICPGTWYVTLSVQAASMAFVGESGASRPLLSAGEKGVVIDIPTDGASASFTGFDITGGKGCLGSAIRAASIPECSRDGISPVAVSLQLSDMKIYGNTYDVGGGAIGITHGSSLVMENTEISGNDGHGVYAQEANVQCTGSPSDRSGSWGNTKYGFWLEFFDAAEHTMTSAGCDFGAGAEDNGFEDVMFNNVIGFEYGDDVNFSCSSLTQTCL